MNVQQIEAMRDQTIAQILDLLATAGPTISVNGVDVVWAPILESLERTLDWCDRKLAEYQPYEVRTRGET